MSRRRVEITPEMMLRAYRLGLFPMAESRDSDTLYWLDPERRGIMPLDGFHIPRRLARTLRQRRFAVSADTDFAGVLALCAAPRRGSFDSWINAEITALFTALHAQGHAHSVECRLDGELVGGLYGVAIGGAFFGESMFSRATDASKVALAHLVARLRLGGYALLDAQFTTDHLAQFGTVEIPRARYKAMLAAALEAPARFPVEAPEDAVLAEIARLREGPATPA